jgi:hypothetical protein
MYRVIKFFTDLHDGNHPYNVGDPFPRDGIEVADERIVELASSDNKQGVPLIEAVEDEGSEDTEENSKDDEE